MQRFMLLFVGRAAQPAPDDAQTQEYNQSWGAWISGLVSEGTVDAAESGSPFAPGGKVVKGDAVVDFEPAEVDVGGYLLISAETLEDAAKIARGAPHLALGGSTIVRPCLAMGG